MKPMPDYIIVTCNSKDYLLRAVPRVFFLFFLFSTENIRVRFSRNLLPRSTGYQIPFLTRYYSEQLRFFVYPFTKFYAVEKQSYVRIIIIVSLSETNTSNLTSPVKNYNCVNEVYQISCDNFI